MRGITALPPQAMRQKTHEEHDGVTDANGTKILLFDQRIRCRTADVKDSGNIVDAIGF